MPDRNSREESAHATQTGRAYAMRQERFPTAAIAKDLSEVDGSLRWRKLRFPRQITLTGPPDAVRDLVSIELTNGEDGNPWTRVLIRGRIEGQE